MKLVSLLALPLANKCQAPLQECFPFKTRKKVYNRGMGGHSLPGAPYSILYCLLMMKPERERERVCIPYEAAGASSFHEPRSSSSTMLRNKGTHLVLAGFFGYWVSSWSGRVARGEGVCLFQRTKHFLVSLLPFHSCIYQKRHEWIMIRIQQFLLCQDTKAKPSPAKPASPTYLLSDEREHHHHHMQLHSSRGKVFLNYHR